MMEFFKSLFKRNKIKSDKSHEEYYKRREEIMIENEKELHKLLDRAQDGWEEMMEIYIPEYCYWGYYYGSLSEKERKRIEKKSPDIFKGVIKEIDLGDLLSGCKYKKEKLKVLKKWKKNREENDDLD